MEDREEEAFHNLKNKIRSIVGGHEDSISLIGYCCDVEGNLQYWENYLSVSLVLRYDCGVVVLRDRCHFVFGGDVCDRGEGDLRVLRAVTGLKERYPARVHLVMGNRDINKLRMRFELAEYTLNTSLGNVYWSPKTLNTGHTAAEKLKWMLLNTLGCPLTFELRRRELAALTGVQEAAVDDAAVVQSFTDLVAPDGLLTKYLMGAELGVVVADVCFCHGALTVGNLGKVPPAVGMSGRPEGAGEPAGLSADLTEPLSGMQVLQGWRVCTGDVREWYRELNDFAHNEMFHYQSTSEEYIQRMCTGEFHRPSPLPSPPTTPRLTTNLSYSTTHTAHTTSVCSQDDVDDEDTRSGGAYWALVGGYAHPQPGSRLLQYGMGWTPDNEKNPSLVYENWLNAKGEPILPPTAVTEYLKRSGIRYVTTGHQPHGDAPLVLTTDDVVYIAADTSYSVNVKWEGEEREATLVSLEQEGHAQCARTSFVPKYDAVVSAGVTRGVAVSEVCFEIEQRDTEERGKVGTAFSHGVLSNGAKYAFPLIHTKSEERQVPPNLLANQDIDPEWWIKGRCLAPDSKSAGETFCRPTYLASKSAKFSVTNKYCNR